MQLVGISSLVTIISHLFFVSVAFWAIQSTHVEKYLHMPMMPGKVLIVLVSVLLGFTCSEFFLSVINNIHNLIFMFK
ncbi:DUF1146 family protein [Acetilactobacillus jinshanensis]|uniref:DUF1146 domain-containing protein n=1 Tax=Acetilactobacillus jinshanensis TaxID=1720083 RepID=A0A4P6ZLM7_9LACO|nr:DUF1146 family protein [Acetilactobacillus jinshanensis]QBP18771.1 DUF1146 domain-containing protein [Acetilactobacillus jinshanensis]URL61642.1 DUF1146 domain-containing protein [uncultured bacterium]